MRDVSANSYVELLRALWGFYLPVESANAPLLGPATPTFDAGERLKTHILERSLARLTSPLADPSNHRVCPAVPVASSVQEAFGIWYVLEGATLGGTIIARELHAALPGLPYDSFAFFLPYGPRCGSMWRQFLRELNECCTTPEGEDSVLTSARATFLAFEAWVFPG